jgi:hypothetical protein
MITSRAEEEVLLCCAREHLDEDSVKQLNALLQKDIEWSYLLRLARDHWVTPLLYWHLNAIDNRAVPRSVMQELEEDFQHNCKRVLFFIGELRQMVELFAASGIRVLPYKGVVLAQYAYENVALRAFSDLDLLIDQRDLHTIKALLLSIGYEPSAKLTETQERIVLSNREYAFKHSFRGTHVEVRWAVWKEGFSLTSIQMGLWERAVPTMLFDTDMLIMPPEDTLLLACVDATKHLWQDLQWICDVAGLIQAHTELNWNALLERARALGSERTLFVGLLLASDVLGTPIPKTVAQTAQSDRIATAAVEYIKQTLFREPKAERRTSIRPLTFHDMVAVLRSTERFRDRVRAVQVMALRPTFEDYRLLPLPAKLFKLYYIVRPLRLAMLYIAWRLKGPRDANKIAGD